MVQPLRAALVAALLVAATGAAPATAQDERCPSPRTCDLYTLSDERWPVLPGQRLVVPYLVNPENAWVPAGDVVRAAQAAAAVWNAVNPRVSLAFRGTTDALPGLQDGRNVVGFGVMPRPDAAAYAPTWSSFEGEISEADVVVDAANPIVWDPCAQRDGACAGHAAPVVPAINLYTLELQSLLTHELGHWLSVAHPNSTDGVELTMFESIQTTRGKEYQTLGLGDVLAARAAYPCGRCGGPPRVFVP